MIKNKRRLALGLVLFFFMAAGLGSLFYTWLKLHGHKEVTNYNAEVQRIEKAKGQTITLTETQAGVRKWVLKMKEILYSQDVNNAKLIGVQGLVYDDKQAVMFTFEAPEGMYDKNKGHFTLTGGARMISPSAKVTIDAPNIDWYSTAKNIQVIGGVSMDKQGFGKSTADKATVTMDFKKIEFIGHANSTIDSHSNTGAKTP